MDEGTNLNFLGNAELFFWVIALSLFALVLGIAAAMWVKGEFKNPPDLEEYSPSHDKRSNSKE